MKGSPPTPPASSPSSSSSPLSVSMASNRRQPARPKPAKRAKTKSDPKRPGRNALAHCSGSPPSRRSSVYRGVTRHRWTGRFEAHLWDKSTWNDVQNKKGRQVYLGAYDDEEAAARTYDLAALKYWGPTTTLNFSIDKYKEELEEMEKVSKEEYLASLRRRSSGFSRGVSKYRGVARHHHNGRWEARIGRVYGNKYLYLGTYNTQEEAAKAYDIAAIEYRGANAVTNFDISNYISHVEDAVDPPLDPANSSEEAAEGESLESYECQKIDYEEAMLEPLHHYHDEATALALSTSDTSASAVMDLYDHQDGNHHHHSHWSHCFDSTGFLSLPVVPDIPFDRSGDLPEFSGREFDDDIDFIFEVGPGQDNAVGFGGEKGLELEGSCWTCDSTVKSVSCSCSA